MCMRESKRERERVKKREEKLKIEKVRKMRKACKKGEAQIISAIFMQITKSPFYISAFVTHFSSCSSLAKVKIGFLC